MERIRIFDEISNVVPDAIIKSINYQNNSINGILFQKHKKRFFKIITKQEMINEQKAINLYSEIFPIKKHLHTYYIIDNLFLVIYEYDLEVSKNEGLLNDYFVKNDFNAYYSKLKMNRVLSVYIESSKKKIWSDKSPIDIFFKDRINSRLNCWYDNIELFEKKVIINGYQSVSTRKILEETKQYFNQPKKHLCFITQGDHNSLNISTTPCFFDVCALGYNYAVGEFAMCFISILIFDQYICPKYHPQSYYNHEKIYENINSYKPKIKYENSNIIKINCDLQVTNIRKQYVLNMLEILKDFDIYDDLFYFIIMRLMCVFNILKFEEEDYYYIIYLVHYFYDKLKNNDYNNLSYLIKELHELGR